mmetsp:Transcript_53975/g.89414  ORF Transcript_53975/g.89414 Transcript_53975/m.89414 type:complete len:123 (-) Transcript_53975:54-422(-)
MCGTRAHHCIQAHQAYVDAHVTMHDINEAVASATEEDEHDHDYGEEDSCVDDEAKNGAIHALQMRHVRKNALSAYHKHPARLHDVHVVHAHAVLVHQEQQWMTTTTANAILILLLLLSHACS